MHDLRPFAWLHEKDPEGNLLTRAAGITVGTLLLVGIIAGARSALMDPADHGAIQNLESRLEQALTPGADFEITDVTYTETGAGGVVTLHLTINNIAEGCANDMLVFDLTRDSGPDLHRVQARWLLGSGAWQGGDVKVPTGHLPEGSYRIVLRACGGFSPPPSTEFVISRNPP